MKQILWHWLDSFIPEDIKDFEQNEELARARALVFILLASSLLALTASLTMMYGSFVLPDAFNRFIGVGLLTCLLGYAAALWVFRYSGSFTLSGNICATISYVANVVGVSVLTTQDAPALLMVLLTLPLLVSLMSGVLSGLVWLGVIVLTPFVQVILGYDNYSKLYLVCWGASSACMLISIYIGHYYREGVVNRLNSERTRFEFAAAHDALTGLSNRATFDRRLRESIEYCGLHGTKAVLAYIDLDSFKPINDTLGHQAGDIVLITIADRLRHLVRKTDTVARLGGDEFAILFDQDCPSDLEPLLRRLNQVVEAPIDVFDNRLSVGCSVGVVVCPDDGLHPHQLAHKADERMYDAKRRNKAMFAART